MIHSAATSPNTAEDELLSAPEALAVGRYLSERGLTCETPGRPITPVSVRHELSMLHAAGDVAGDALITLRIGLGLHLTTYGIAGSALLSSASLRQALQVAAKYDSLLSLKLNLNLDLSGGDARLYLENRCAGLDPELKQLCLQLEVAKLCTLLRDIATCDVNRIGMAESPAGLRPELETLLGAPVLCGTERTFISLDRAILDAPLPQAHAIKHQSCLHACDQLIAEHRRRQDIRARVRAMILSANGTVPALAEVARRLFLSTRTLRRRLEEAQTSYQDIVGEIRRDLAVRYLTETTLTTDIIAERLGYSDTANFRQAFKRWVGESPQRYRRKALFKAPGSTFQEEIERAMQVGSSHYCAAASAAAV
jgi:AraC-like DNA-binding protein